MKVTDPAWIHIATLAGVRTTHCWHLFCYLKATKGKFAINPYATFAGLEPRHVARMLEVFEAEGLCAPAQAATAPLAARGTRLPADFTMPDEWLQWAKVQRSWTDDVTATEAAAFIDHFHAKTGADAVKLDWLATWRNWVRAPWKKNGERPTERKSESVPDDPREYIEYCKTQIANASRVNNVTQIRIWRQKLEAAELRLGAKA